MSDLKKTFKEDSEETKKAFVFNGENVTVKYNYSFKAKLSLASDDVKNQYKEIISVLNKYGVKTSASWKQERVYLGRNTYAVILFKGSKLCVAYALDPKEYVESKYKAIDASDVKRFQATPTILKITSLRKLGYASSLFEILFAENKIEKKTDDVKEISVETKTKEELINLELIKVTVSKKSGEEVSLDEEKKIISEAITLDENDVVEDSDEEEDSLESNKNEDVCASTIIMNPKHGNHIVFNVCELEEYYTNGETVDLDSLTKKGLVAHGTYNYKILGSGLLNVKLNVNGKCSKNAVNKVLACGGSVKR